MSATRLFFGSNRILPRGASVKAPCGGNLSSGLFVGPGNGFQARLSWHRTVHHLFRTFAGSVVGLMAEVVEDHIRTHLVDPERNPGALNADAADQLIEVVHTYLK